MNKEVFISLKEEIIGCKKLKIGLGKKNKPIKKARYFV